MWSPPPGTARELVVAGDDREAAGDLAVRDRDARCRGHRDGARHTGNHLDGDAVCLAREPLLASTPQHVGVAPLEADDRTTRQRLGDEEVVDALLRDGVLPGCLADVDDPHAGGEAVDHRAGRQAVDDDDVGHGEQLAGARREQPLGAGSTPHQRDPAPVVPRLSAAQVECPAGEDVVDRAGHVGAQCPVGAGVCGDGHRDVPDGGRRGGGELRRGAVEEGGQAPDAGSHGVGQDRVVDGQVAGRRVDEPGTVEVVGTGVVPLGPRDLPRQREGGQLLAEPGGDDLDECSSIDEGLHTRGRRRAAPDRDDAPPGEVEPDGQGHRGCSPGASASAMTAARVRPSSGSTRRNAPPRREVE